MIITDFLERNARLYGAESALVEINPSEARDKAVTWWDFNLIESAGQDAPYRREMSWKDFDRRANRFANLLLSRGLKKGTKVAILLMNCLEWLPIYFGILKAGCIAVPMNFRYASDEIKYCLELADVDVLVFGPEFVTRMDAICNNIPTVKTLFYVGSNGPAYTEDCLNLMGFCSSSAPPIAMTEQDDAVIYFSSGTNHNYFATVFKPQIQVASVGAVKLRHGFQVTHQFQIGTRPHILLRCDCGTDVFQCFPYILRIQIITVAHNLAYRQFLIRLQKTFYKRNQFRHDVIHAGLPVVPVHAGRIGQSDVAHAGILKSTDFRTAGNQVTIIVKRNCKPTDFTAEDGFQLFLVLPHLPQDFKFRQILHIRMGQGMACYFVAII